jgi:hypothetical protein
MSACSFSEGKPEGKRSLPVLRYRWEDYVIMDLAKIS